MCLGCPQRKEYTLEAEEPHTPQLRGSHSALSSRARFPLSCDPGQALPSIQELHKHLPNEQRKDGQEACSKSSTDYTEQWLLGLKIPLHLGDVAVSDYTGPHR